MRASRVALVVASAAVIWTGLARAQNAPDASRPAVPDARASWHIAPESSAVRDMRRRQTLVATRAIGYFMAADAIEASLQNEGLTLHSDIAVLRVRLEAALNQTEAAIDRGDLDQAGKSMDVAQALLDRFAAKLGG